MTIKQHLEKFPFVAITRGLKTEEVEAYTEVMLENGFTIIETPLNSPEPFKTIGKMVEKFGNKALIGAGTVICAEDVDRVNDVGGKLIVSPDCNVDVIKRAKQLGLVSLPGVISPTEAFTALKAGADGLKLFPFEMVTLQGMKAMRAVLSKDTLMLPVSGVDANNWQELYKAGANGFGLGTSLYHAEISLSEFKEKAAAFKNSWDQYQAK